MNADKHRSETRITHQACPQDLEANDQEEWRLRYFLHYFLAGCLGIVVFVSLVSVFICVQLLLLFSTSDLNDGNRDP
jgi:hypothetical protein